MTFRGDLYIFKVLKGINHVSETLIWEISVYNWRKKYGGMSVSDARRLKELESENDRLKRIMTNKELEVDALKNVPVKKLVAPDVQRQAVDHMHERYVLCQTLKRGNS